MPSLLSENIIIKPLLLVGAFIILFFSCKDDSDPCANVELEFSPNGYKYFLPYEKGQKILFSNPSGGFDTITVNNYDLPQNSYTSRNCFQSTESLDVDLKLKYDSINTCHINVWSDLEQIVPYLIFNGDDCQFQASFADFPSLGNSTITRIPDYQYNNNSYEVLSVKIDSVSEIDEFVLAKNLGFLFLKINGIVRNVK